jgi:Glycogen recognition site of AMP-activated protein kinase
MHFKNALYSAWIFILWHAPVSSILAQLPPVKSPFGVYFIEGENVAFQFDAPAYIKALHGPDSAAVDFADLNLIEPLQKGSTGEWIKEGWRLRQIDDNRYQVYKPCHEFTDAPDWQFKLLLQGVYWIVPAPKAEKKGVLGNYETPDFNVQPTVLPNDTGNVLFTLKGFARATRVILAGSFNGWHEQALPMRRTEEGWAMRLDLGPGRYEYKFIADGQWLHDPANKEKKVNEHGTYNSVLWVGRPVRFMLKGYPHAQKVMVAGPFNQWSRTASPMRPTADGWVLDTILNGTKHLYKFIVDGAWVLDPANARTEKTWDGYVNSVLIIR